MKDISKRKALWSDFLSGIPAVKNTFIVNCTWQDTPRPMLWPELKEERIDWAFNKYEMQMENMQWLDDDTVPYLDMLTGTEMFAEAFGCKVFRPNDNNPFALPLIQNASEVQKIKVPNLFDSSLSYLFDMADKLYEKAGKDAIFRLPDIQSPMDIASLIWDKNDFFIAILEEPDAVKELSHKVFILLTNFLDEWFRRYGKSFVAHFPAYYMEKGITLSEDDIGIINQEMFRNMYLPELVELSNMYGGIGIHCCANSRHQWENFKLIPGLKLLNLDRPNDVLSEAYEFFADTTSQYHSWRGEGPAWTWIGQHPANTRFVLEADAKSKEEAQEICRRLNAALNRR